MASHIQGINVVFIFVADLPAARRFYEDCVGMPTPSVVTDDWVEYALPHGANFALHRTTPQSLNGVDPCRNTIAFSMIVEDLESTYQTLVAAGVQFSRAPEKGQGFRLAEFLDPEGNHIRLIQPSPQSA